MWKKIKCDIRKEDHIEVDTYINGYGDGGFWPSSVVIAVTEDEAMTSIELQSPAKVDKLIKALEKAKRKVWRETE